VSDDDDGLPDRCRCRVEIEVAPAETERFAATHARGGEEPPQGRVTITCSFAGAKEDGELVR